MYEDQFGEFVCGYWGKRLLNSYFPFKLFIFVFESSVFLKLSNNTFEIRLSLVTLMKAVSFGRCKVMEMMTIIKTYCNNIARNSDER